MKLDNDELQNKAFGCGEPRNSALEAGKSLPARSVTPVLNRDLGSLEVTLRPGANRHKAQNWCRFCGGVWKAWIKGPVFGDPGPVFRNWLSTANTYSGRYAEKLKKNKEFGVGTAGFDWPLGGLSESHGCGCSVKAKRATSL